MVLIKVNINLGGKQRYRVLATLYRVRVIGF